MNTENASSVHGTVINLSSSAGKPEDEGDHREGAQSQAPPPGVPQSSKGKAAQFLEVDSFITGIKKKIWNTGDERAENVLHFF